MKRPGLCVMILFLILSLARLNGIAVAGSPDPHSLRAPRFAPDRVLVKFNPGTAKSEIGEAHSLAGGRILKTIPGIGVQVVGVPSGTVTAKVNAYRANPNVFYAEPDFYRVMVVPNEEPGPTPAGGANYFEEQWYLHNVAQLHSYQLQTIFGPVLELTFGAYDADIDAPEAWETSRGLATTDPSAYHTPKVAVLDSGADCDTLELQGKCLEQVNLVGLDPGYFGLDPCSADKPACDNLGHGTFVASEVGSNSDNWEGIAGVGWNTNLGIFKVCYQELVTDGINLFVVGLCPLSASAEAIALAATDQVDAWGNVSRSQYHVITMSYGSDLINEVTGEIMPSSPPNTECDAVLYAWENGVVVVAGAGNNGDTGKFYPAACTDDLATGGGQSTVIAVAASNDRDNRAGFSNYSTDADDWVSMAAPGEAIIGILPDYHCSLPSGSDSCVNWWDGTSMAAPLVAGGAALVWEDVYQQAGFDGVYAPFGCTVDGTSCNRVVRQRLEDGADKIGTEGQDLLAWTRHGRLNIAGALTAQGVVTFTLTVTKTGGGAGTVSSLDGGIFCGANCTETYPEGTLVTLTADPSPGSYFSRWGEDCASYEDTATVTIDADKTCEAVFVQDPGADTAPGAHFQYFCQGVVCDFDGSASSDDNGIISFTWDFGDGQAASGIHAQHTYSMAGTYQVTLTVTDTVSQQNTVTALVSPKVKGKTKGGSDTKKGSPRGAKN